MDYRDYQLASYKHLSTCQSILDSISIFTAAKDPNALIIKDLKVSSVLSNVFYLSGYTLEGIINYAIYKHFKWKLPSVQETDHSFSNKCDLSFFPNCQRKTGGTYNYCISLHQFQRNIQVLTKALPSSGIPLIDRSVAIDPTVLKLFMAWTVEVRYHKVAANYSTVPINLANVTKFVDATDLVYNGLMKLVG
ncbi:hypothetical protein [Mucilaginibacter antarcticus]|uniref:Uncharacterized protein n=1 Tax=Mucilaginibacter antarcticus TaxID=1855725 RepID=A0ABW5XNV3_9SPHI